MLEVRKTYKAIQDKEKLIEFEVLKVNKKSYTIMLKDKKETLWVGNQGGLYIKNPSYSKTSWDRVPQNPSFDIVIISDKEAMIWEIENNIKYQNHCIRKYETDLKDLEMQEEEIREKKADLKNRINIRLGELRRLNDKLKEVK
jgi:ligand-binding sensor domain-containing protein